MLLSLLFVNQSLIIIVVRCNRDNRRDHLLLSQVLQKYVQSGEAHALTASFHIIYIHAHFSSLAHTPCTATFAKFGLVGLGPFSCDVIFLHRYRYRCHCYCCHCLLLFVIVCSRSCLLSLCVIVCEITRAIRQTSVLLSLLLFFCH